MKILFIALLVVAAFLLFAPMLAPGMGGGMTRFGLDSPGGGNGTGPQAYIRY
jgi:hypothetical protein